jgi:hypothetical protein
MKEKIYIVFVWGIVFGLLAACSTAGSIPQMVASPTPAASAVTETSPAPVELPIIATETSPAEVQSEPVQEPPTSTPESENEPAVSEATELPTATPRVPPEPDAWSSLPVIPVVSENAIAIYQRGLDLGRNPHAFSKIGDCQNVSSYFLSPFAYASAYNLGTYTSLQETIDWFQESSSFTRESLAVKGGFNVAAVLSPLRSDPKVCEAGESPLQCEIRIHNPSVAIISMETWWSGEPDKYERYMRELLDQTIEAGVVPILGTKADNLEGENQINIVLAKLAWEYDIPLWNFWASVQDLKDKGLTSDGFHLTLGNYMYNDPVSSASGWSLRNLTALQALDAVRRGIMP